MNYYYSKLSEIGYKLHDRGKNWSARPLYRISDSEKVLSICKETGRFYDFKLGQGGSFKKLLQLSNYEVDEFSDDQDFLIGKRLTIDHKRFPLSASKKLIKDYKFFNDLGFKDRILKDFGAGLACDKLFKNRMVFPIFDEKKSCINGFCGRTVKESKIKWLIYGSKKSWSYPLFLTKPYIEKTKQIILVEGVSDGLKLWQAGKRNFAVLFGISLGSFLFKRLVSLNPSKIILSLDNDEAGQKGTDKIVKELHRFFNKGVVDIVKPFPLYKDIGAMEIEKIKELYG